MAISVSSYSIHSSNTDGLRSQMSVGSTSSHASGSKSQIGSKPRPPVEAVPWIVYEYAPEDPSESQSAHSQGSSSKTEPVVRMHGRGGAGSKPRKPKESVDLSKLDGSLKSGSSHDRSTSVDKLSSIPTTSSSSPPASPPIIRVVGRGGSGSKPRNLNTKKSISFFLASIPEPSQPTLTPQISAPPSMPIRPEPEFMPLRGPECPPLQPAPLLRVGGRGGAGSRARVIKPAIEKPEKPKPEKPQSDLLGKRLKWMKKGMKNKGKQKAEESEDDGASLRFAKAPARSPPDPFPRFEPIAVLPRPPAMSSFVRKRRDSSPERADFVSERPDFAHPDLTSFDFSSIRPLPRPPSPSRPPSTSLSRRPSSPSLYSVESDYPGTPSEMTSPTATVASSLSSSAFGFGGARKLGKLSRTLGEGVPREMPFKLPRELRFMAIKPPALDFSHPSRRDSLLVDSLGELNPSISPLRTPPLAKRLSVNSAPSSPHANSDRFSQAISMSSQPYVDDRFDSASVMSFGSSQARGMTFSEPPPPPKEPVVTGLEHDEKSVAEEQDEDQEPDAQFAFVASRRSSLLNSALWFESDERRKLEERPESPFMQYSLEPASFAFDSVVEPTVSTDEWNGQWNSDMGHVIRSLRHLR
ncbi:hypothetical protein C8J56DRAFT_400386 [Mycena floridula]|nr:hypothetical protein C8J56DRAFT_400386 [Mycena floridula]